jgi:hypothetical protein
MYIYSCIPKIVNEAWINKQCSNSWMCISAWMNCHLCTVTSECKRSYTYIDFTLLFALIRRLKKDFFRCLTLVDIFECDDVGTCTVCDIMVRKTFYFIEWFTCFYFTLKTWYLTGIDVINLI